MRIFLDTADVKAVEKFYQLGILDGVTTNPTHLAKAGGNPVSLIKHLSTIMPDGLISVEVTERDEKKVYAQALKISELGENILVKIPAHEKYYSIINQLVIKEVPLNITLIFTAIQALIMAKMGVDFVSPFVGRLDDISADGMQLVDDIKELFDMYEYEANILAASLRSVKDVLNALKAGADVVTVPVEVAEKMIRHPLTENGMEKFLSDWEKLGYSQFP
jgi:transaldolase